MSQIRYFPLYRHTLHLLLAHVYYSLSFIRYYMKNNVIAEISVIPIGTGKTSLSQYVAGCAGLLEGCEGIEYRLTSMGTIIEGPIDRVLDLARKMHEAPFAAGVGRVVTTIKIDDRRDKEASMKKKVESVLKANAKIKADL
jgi:uncharacterized protein (TIGR00106 family)